MGRNKNQSFAKRRREQARQERATQKRTKRKLNAAEGSDGTVNDISHIVAGPQARDEATDEEVARAMERAVNPGSAREGNAAGKAFGNRLFVGNLDRLTEGHEIGAFFREAGFEVVEAKLMLDRMSGESRGFAFVELADANQAKKAITQLAGVALHGRELRINLADSGGRR